MHKQAILFLIDTQGANCVGCYAGNKALSTPNVDRLATEGVRFDRAYTCSPVCGPARSAIFTGLYPHSNGVLANNMAPHSDIPTIGKRLRDAGVLTGYIGKWHLDGTDYFGDGHCPPGWDTQCWFDGRNYLDSLPDQASRDLARRSLGPADVAEHGITAEFTHAHRTADRACNFIARHKDEDFFLVVSIDEPHHPAICPEPFVSAFGDFRLPVPNAHDSLAGKPELQRQWAAHAKPFIERQLWSGDDGTAQFRFPGHFACNSFCDYEVGRVLEAIGSNAPNALTIYTADHGDMFGSHGLSGKGPAMYEEITRIPLIARWPGHAAAGTPASGPVSHIDLAPTFLEYFGVTVPQLLQGSSLLGQIREPSCNTNEYIFIEFNRYEVDHDRFGEFTPIRCVFDGRYKLAVNLLDSDELYDLEADPHETNNLVTSPEYAQVRDRLHDRLIAWMGTTRDPLRGPHWRQRHGYGQPRSAWTGPTRPRPNDLVYEPATLLYETGKPPSE